jgi:hypothetical protein
MIQIVMSIFTLSYIIYVKPFESPKHNYREIFNESTFLLVSYTLPIYSDFVNDFTIKDHAGNFMMLMIICNFVVNVLLILYDNLMMLYLAIKHFLRKRRHLKQIA